MLMDRLEVRHLPVLTGRRLVGCVSLRDLQSAGTEGAQTEAKSVEKTDSTRERHVVLLQATDMFEMAMQVEKSGEAFYRAAADKVDSHGVKDLFEDLALQEVRHYEFFRSLFQSIRGQPLLTAEQWHEYQGYLGATVQSAFFEGPDKALALAETVKDHHEAVRMAMEFEKETLLFFYDLRDIVPASGRKAVHEIVEEEKSHIRRLAGMLQDNG
jgi:rubrerythrin